jgi:glyoxylase-like metal-dependent hydrolase (beta-lactamase superfamily II)
MTNRRSVLKSVLGGVASVALAPLASRALAAGSVQVSRVTDELALLTGAGGNVLALAADGGRVLVDSGAAELSDVLLATLGELPGAGRVQALFNTHWHLDQVGSNAAIGRMGAAIIAHEKTRLRLATDYYLPAEDRYQKALPAEAQPTESFYTNGETTVGGVRIEYGYLLEAHTDGDVYVFFRDANVLAVGDVVSPARDPVLDWFGGGWLGGRVDALDRLLRISDAQTRFVPSYGPVIGRAEVQAEHDMMLVLFERMVELVRKGQSAADVLAEGVMNDLGRSFDDPLKFVYDAHKGLWAHHNTLSPDVV